jgi:hypothetical protein
LEPIGSLANWHCIVLEELEAVELLEGSWRTAPNHSRPASCVVEADVAPRINQSAIRKRDSEESM